MKGKKSKIQVAVKPSPELEHSIEEFADVITDSLKDEYQPDLETFEVYAQKIRAHIYDNVNEFRSRFGHGYLLLLEELEKERRSQDDENVIKP